MPAAPDTKSVSRTKATTGRPALELDMTRVSTPTVIPGINGVFNPGVPVALADLGMTQREAQLLISDGLPLALTRVPAMTRGGKS